MFLISSVASAVFIAVILVSCGGDGDPKPPDAKPLVPYERVPGPVINPIATRK